MIHDDDWTSTSMDTKIGSPTCYISSYDFMTGDMLDVRKEISLDMLHVTYLAKSDPKIKLFSE